MILRVSTQALKESFEYFESIQVTDNIKLFVTDIQHNTRHDLYQYIIRFKVNNKIIYRRRFGSLLDVTNDLNDINVWYFGGLENAR